MFTSLFPACMGCQNACYAQYNAHFYLFTISNKIKY